MEMRDIKPYVKVLLYIISIFIVFFVLALYNINLPGLYMDAVNPDYIAGMYLNPRYLNPIWILPNSGYPILGSFYHGTPTLSIGLVFYALFGMSTFVLRTINYSYGAITIILSFFIIKKITENNLCSFTGAIYIATSIAFIASFKTQYYSVQVGLPFLFGAIYFLMDRFEQVKILDGKRVYLSGILMGLAFYCYFVYSFFVVGFLVYIALIKRQKIKAIFIWLLGFVTSSSLYIIGYGIILVKLGGIAQFSDWLRSSLIGLNVMGESKEVINKILLSVEHAYYAISNKGNELYIFGEELIDKTKNLNIFITILIVLIGCIALLITKKIKKHFNYLLIYILPISFIICSSVFATRIGAHHFGVITPLIGVILGISINNIIEIDQVKLSKEFKVIVSIIFVIIIGLNLISYNEFNEKLEKTGGVKMFSEEIDKMALDAKENPNESVYYFIDWGFMMPFMFITENNVPYFTDLNQDTI